jgi:16S rRNA (adenine1518-N6/adenine1519-N6)-dimethyltransferase
MRIKELLNKYRTRPSKRLGQNFLVNEGIIKKIVDASSLNKENAILEIGPGLGVLTKELAQKVGKVIAIEKDAKLCEALKETLKEFENIEIINKDILSYQLPINNLRYKVVANLPFNIASAIIKKFLESENPPKEMILMVQKEVAQRICQKPPKMSLLAVSIQFYAKVEILFYVSKGSFYPPPKIDAAVIKITPLENKISLFKPDLFFKIVRTGFSHPRKQLASNLAKELNIDKNEANNWLDKSEVNPKRRAETLTIEEWKKLTNLYTGYAL